MTSTDILDIFILFIERNKTNPTENTSNLISEFCTNIGGSEGIVFSKLFKNEIFVEILNTTTTTPISKIFQHFIQLRVMFLLQRNDNKRDRNTDKYLNMKRFCGVEFTYLLRMPKHVLHRESEDEKCKLLKAIA